MPDLRNRPADLGDLSPALARMRPAPASRRTLARFTDVVVLLVAGGLLGYVQRTLPDASDPASVRTVAIGVQAVTVLLLVGLLVWFARTGRGPGDQLFGLRQVKVRTARPPGWAGVGKYLLLWLVSVPTAGLAYLVTGALSVNARFSRSWVDRLCGLVVADVRAGRDPVLESLGPAEVPAVTITAAVAALSRDDPAVLDAAAPVPAPPEPGSSTVRRPDPWTRVNPQVGGSLSPVRVRMPGGATVEVSGPTAFGRNPSPPPDRPTTALAVVSDPGKSVSKTHALLTPQAGGLLVEDLHSTNGTSVITANGHEVAVTPGERISAQIGWKVALGRVLLVVEDA